jgi:hypothetical protein
VDYRDMFMPYDLCWFDYVSRVASLALEPGQSLSTKRAVLARRYLSSIEFFVFPFVDSRKLWSPPAYLCSVDLESKTVQGFPCVDNPLAVFGDSCSYEKGMIEDVGDVGHVLKCIMLLNCKNIGTETVPAPIKLNTKRKKAGKQPLFSYHTLVIKPVGKRQESIPRHLWNNAVHLQRGHFKTYTEKAPLFGSIVGRFWWQPHVRGQNNKRVVMKDYVISPEDDR